MPALVSTSRRRGVARAAAVSSACWQRKVFAAVGVAVAEGRIVSRLSGRRGLFEVARIDGATRASGVSVSWCAGSTGRSGRSADGFLYGIGTDMLGASGASSEGKVKERSTRSCGPGMTLDLHRIAMVAH